MPRALQCLFSRWRCGQVDSCGGYARHLGFLADDGSLCRFCCQAKESPFHLCTTCMAFTTYRWVHNISLDTLFYDSPRNILAIATFDNYISQTLPYIQQPPIQQPLSNIIQIARKHRITSNSDESSPSEPPVKQTRTHQNQKRHLVIPTTPIPKKQKKEWK